MDRNLDRLQEDTAMLNVTVVDRASGGRAEFQARPDEPLLDQLEEACDFEVPNLCWMGACGTCALRVQCGHEHVEPDAFGVGASIQVQPGYILPCAAGACEKAIADSRTHSLLVEVA